MLSLSQELCQKFEGAAMRCLNDLQSDSILILSTNFDLDGQYVRDAGVRTANAVLRSAAATEQMTPGILMFGVLSEAEFRLMAGRLADAAPLIDWPGFRYLRLPFEIEEFRAAAVAALMGRTAPIPLPTVSELHASIANVLHWLERVRQGQAGTARILADVARGEFELPRRNLEPEACLSPKQREGLHRLCERLSLAIGMEHSREWAALLQNDIAAQDVASQRLEQLKAAFQSLTILPDAEGLQMLAKEARSVAEKATALFERVRYIEAQIIERATGDYD